MRAALVLLATLTIGGVSAFVKLHVCSNRGLHVAGAHRGGLPRDMALHEMGAGLAGLASLGFGLLSRPERTEAAVPTVEEYFDPSAGARPKRSSYLNKSGSKESTAAAAKEKPPAPDVLVPQAKAALADLDPLITQERWDDILRAMKSSPLSFLLQPYLGYASAAELSTSLGVPQTKAKVIEQAREELGVGLQQLVDFAFSNRVIFFNLADKKAIDAMASGKEPMDLSEPRALLKDAVFLLDELAKAI